MKMLFVLHLSIAFYFNNEFINNDCQDSYERGTQQGVKENVF